MAQARSAVATASADRPASVYAAASVPTMMVSLCSVSSQARSANFTAWSPSLSSARSLVASTQARLLLIGICFLARPLVLDAARVTSC